MRHRVPPDVLLLVTVLFWSFNFTVVKYALTHGWEPLAYSSVRFAIGALLFSGYTYARESSLRVRRSDVLFMTGAALSGIWLNQLSFVFAVKLTTAATVALMFGTLPIFVALVSWAFGLERLRLRHWTATVISFSGVALVAAGASSGLSGDLGGILLGLAASATWAVYSAAMVPLMRRYSPFRLSAVFLLAVTPLLALAGSQQLAHQRYDFGALVWIGFAFAVLGPLVITNLLWFTAIDRVGPSRASLFANLQPFLAAIIALVLLSEPITTVQIIGGVAIAAGIALSPRRTAPRPPAE